MKEYTITPINTGMVNSNKANYLYHNSTHKYYDVEGNIQLPVTVIFSTERRQEDPDRHRNVQY